MIMIDFYKVFNYIYFRILQLPDKSFADQRQILEHVLKKFESKEKKNQILKIFAEKLSCQ